MIELDNGLVAHVWLQSSSDEQLQQVMNVARDLRFKPDRREVAGGK